MSTAPLVEKDWCQIRQPGEAVAARSQSMPVHRIVTAPPILRPYGSTFPSHTPHLDDHARRELAGPETALETGAA